MLRQVQVQQAIAIQVQQPMLRQVQQAIAILVQQAMPMLRCWAGRSDWGWAIQAGAQPEEILDKRLWRMSQRRLRPVLHS